jgi:hypothetical protein
MEGKKNYNTLSKNPEFVDPEFVVLLRSRVSRSEVSTRERTKRDAEWESATPRLARRRLLEIIIPPRKQQPPAWT